MSVEVGGRLALMDYFGLCLSATLMFSGLCATKLFLWWLAKVVGTARNIQAMPMPYNTRRSGDLLALSLC